MAESLNEKTVPGSTIAPAVTDDNFDLFGYGAASYFGNLAIPITLAVVAVLLTIFLFLKNRKPRDTILLLGLSDAGKTFIFTKLIGRRKSVTSILKTATDAEWECYKSMAENVADVEDSNGKPVRLVDYPGAERLRNNLFEGWLGKCRAQIRRILFVVDSDTFSKKARDVAELVHDVLINSDNDTKVLIACNKQDLDTAKSSKAIRNLLEKEVGLICQTRNRTLESTTDSKAQSLCPEGEFSWSKFSQSVSFKDLTAVERPSLESIQLWVLDA